jgi:hypothetical protein
MKFLVSDRQDERHSRIRSFLTNENAVIAALLAAVDLEWTIRRVLDHALQIKSTALSQRPISGLKAYAMVWAKVFNGRGGKPLPSVVEDWQYLIESYQLRHDLVHGRQGSGSLSYVTKRVDCILAASKAIASFGLEHQADPYTRLRKRRLYGPTTRKDKTNSRDAARGT